MRSAFLIDIISKQVSSEDVSRCHRDELDGGEVTGEADSGIDEDRSLELRLDLVVVKDQVKVRHHEEQRELQDYAGLRRSDRRLSRRRRLRFGLFRLRLFGRW